MNTVDGNTENGFVLQSSSSNTLIENTATGCVIGFSLEPWEFWIPGLHLGSSDNILKGNSANNNDIGFFLVDSSGNNLNKNMANNNLAGFILYLSDNNNLKKNTANYNSQIGFLLWDSPSNRISKNTAFNNGVFDVELDGVCFDNIFKKNNFGKTNPLGL